MAIDSKSPEISVLRQRVEARFGQTPMVHAQFVILGDEIFRQTKEHVSETTLERIWNYSTRGYQTVSLRSLDVLCRYIGISDWNAFLLKLKEENGSESDIFDVPAISTKNLDAGSRIKIGWQPDRVCIVRYLGDNRFVCEESRNAKMKPGDSFSCLQMQLHNPLYLDDFSSPDLPAGSRYGIGLRHGLTVLQVLS